MHCFQSTLLDTEGDTHMKNVTSKNYRIVGYASIDVKIIQFIK